MFIEYDKYLTMVAQLRRGTKDVDGDVTYTHIATVNCLYYFGATDRFSSSYGPAQQVFIDSLPRHYVILPGEYNGTVQMGDSLYDIRDEDGEAVLANGLVEERVTYRHWGYGPQLTQVRVGVEDA